MLSSSALATASNERPSRAPRQVWLSFSPGSSLARLLRSASKSAAWMWEARSSSRRTAIPLNGASGEVGLLTSWASGRPRCQ